MEYSNPIKLYIQRDISSPAAAFAIFDELGNEKYRAVSEKTGTAKRLTVKTSDGISAAKIRRVTLPDIYAYTITAGGKTIRLLLSFVKREPVCYCYGVNWLIGGNLYAKAFTISDVDNTIVAVHKRAYSSCGRCCELTVSNPKNELLCVCASICINMFDSVDKLAPQAV